MINDALESFTSIEGALYGNPIKFPICEEKLTGGHGDGRCTRSIIPGG